MPVGTRGAVRTLSSADLEALGAEVVLANTYHLMLRPGRRRRRRGSAACTASPAGTATCSPTPAATRSSRSSPTVDDDGVTFRSTYDGSRHRLTPEGAVDVQVQLGADIQMVLDVCPPLPSPPAVAAARPSSAPRCGPSRARKAFLAHGRDDLSPVRHRPGRHRPRAAGRERRSAPSTLGFDGYAHRRAVGGRGPRPRCCPALAAALAALPADRPRYLMGVGDPVGHRRGGRPAASTCSTACCPTRLARHGTILTVGRAAQPPQRPLRRPTTARSTRPARCPVCARWSRGYLRHLLLGGRAHRAPAAHPPQRGLDPRPRRPDPGRHPARARSATLRAEVARALGRDRYGVRRAGCRRPGDGRANLVRLPMEPLLILARHRSSCCGSSSSCPQQRRVRAHQALVAVARAPATRSSPPPASTARIVDARRRRR